MGWRHGRQPRALLSSASFCLTENTARPGDGSDVSAQGSVEAVDLATRLTSVRRNAFRSDLRFDAEWSATQRNGSSCRCPTTLCQSVTLWSANRSALRAPWNRPARTGRRSARAWAGRSRRFAVRDLGARVRCRAVQRHNVALGARIKITSRLREECFRAARNTSNVLCPTGGSHVRQHASPRQNVPMHLLSLDIPGPAYHRARTSSRRMPAAAGGRSDADGAGSRAGPSLAAPGNLSEFEPEVTGT